MPEDPIRELEMTECIHHHPEGNTRDFLKNDSFEIGVGDL